MDDNSKQISSTTPFPPAGRGQGDGSGFRYFADPHHFSTYQATPRRCDVCGELRPGYADAFFTEPNGQDVRFVCEPDLRAGNLAQVGAQVNNGDRFALAEQIAERHRDWNEAQVENYVNERNRELEVCTPSITTWQDYEWPAHCADYMRFVKEIGQADCDRLSDGGNGRAFLERYLEASYKQDEDEADVHATVDELWDRMRPDSPTDNCDVTPTSFYLFQCLECGDYLIEWDSEGVEHADIPDAGSLS